MKKILLLFLLGLLAYACAKVPLTGRSQLAVVSNEEIMPLVNAEYQKFKGEAKLVTNTSDGQQVVRVGQRISQAVEKFLIQEGYEDLVKTFSWEFNLAESKEINAWCMPGGKVAFYTGIMPVCQDENGIAVVMGHEV
ncbi:MAG: M48 family metalloprotease, partial [Cyclobacteriaceae bacterium]|nr:M48 family metalloprotease [Cyclobacteriaceae bacterium]MDX5467870.1 M48 family metalloprotease [Cyclobacteriaceae bacterium]